MTSALVGFTHADFAFSARESPTRLAMALYVRAVDVGLKVFSLASLFTTSNPSTTRPNTIFLPSNEGTGAGPVVIKNCAVVPYSPSFCALSKARETVPGRKCFPANAYARVTSPFSNPVPSVATCPNLGVPALPPTTYPFSLSIL